MMRFTLYRALLAALILLIGFAAHTTGNATNLEALDKTTITLSVEDATAGDVLRLLATQGGLNLSLSSSVTGNVTVSLREVTLINALNVVTASVGADWYVSDEVIVVKSASEKHQLQSRTELIKLQYLSADAAERLVSDMVGDRGTVKTLSGKTQEGAPAWDEMIQVTASPKTLQRVHQVLAKADYARPLVEIEARVIETSLTGESRLGINFPDRLNVTIGGLEGEQDDDGATIERNFASHPLDDGKWTWGKLTAAEVSVILDYLIQNGNSRLLSNPRVTTTSNQAARIEVLTTIPIQTVNRFTEGAVIQDIVTFEDLDVGLSLEVVPRVTRDSSILLDVHSVVEEILGYTGPVDNQRPITSKRDVTSSVRVKAGESLGIGGLMKEAERVTTKKVPLLGSIPLLGRVFQHKTTTTEQTDLLILITPRLVATK
ncbi:hypothetical protein GF356_07725 [candidate division GN15 bacterium]|nr:hypothetical protein [candidate division GN15 bacterium]